MSRKRWLLFLATSALAVAIIAWASDWSAVQSWLWVHTGTGNEPGSFYGFFSGFGSDLGEYVIIVGIATGVTRAARAHNCHIKGCWRVGGFPVADYRVCRKHHDQVRQPLTPGVLQSHHVTEMAVKRAQMRQSPP